MAIRAVPIHIEDVASELGLDADRMAAFLDGFTGATYRQCGCTDDDCSGCIERTGDACYWVEDDLCSACAGTEAGLL